MIQYNTTVTYNMPAMLAPSRPILSKREFARHTSADVKRAVARAFGISPDDLTGQRRYQRFALARFAAYDLIRRQRCLSYPQIGAIMGGRDHSTVIYGIRRCGELRKADPDFAARYEEARGG